MTTSQCSGDCGSGKYSLGDTEAGPTADDCISCVAGKYIDTPGSTDATACIDCDAGKYSTVEGSSAIADCISCALGKFGIASGSNVDSNCIDCIAGKYVNVAGSDQVSDCIDCTADKWYTLPRVEVHRRQLALHVLQAGMLLQVRISAQSATLARQLPQSSKHTKRTALRVPKARQRPLQVWHTE